MSLTLLVDQNCVKACLLRNYVGIVGTRVPMDLSVASPVILGRRILLSPRRKGLGGREGKALAGYQVRKIAWGGRPCGHPLGRCLPLEGSQHRFPLRPSWPLEGCFDATQPQQDTPGHSSGRRVMRLVRRGDVRASVAKLMIKGGHSVAVPTRRTMRLSSLVIEEKLVLRAKGTSTVGPPTSSYVSRLTVLADGGFSAPTIVSTIMDQVHGLRRCGGLGRPSIAPTAPIKGGSPPP